MFQFKVKLLKLSLVLKVYLVFSVLFQVVMILFIQIIIVIFKGFLLFGVCFILEFVLKYIGRLM